MSQQTTTTKTKKTPKHPGWKARMMVGRRAEAEKRQAERDKRSPQEQILHLDSFLGVGKGATRERARLAEVIRNPRARKQEVVDVPSADADAPKPKVKAKDRRAAQRKGKDPA